MDSSSSFISFFAVWLTHVINLSSQESSHGTAVFWLLVISKKKIQIGWFGWRRYHNIFQYTVSEYGNSMDCINNRCLSLSR